MAVVSLVLIVLRLLELRRGPGLEVCRVRRGLVAGRNRAAHARPKPGP